MLRLPRNERFKARLGRRFFIRFHMSCILMATFSFALSLNWLIVALGGRGMMLRYAVVLFSAYAAFFGFVRLWLGYIQGGRRKASTSSGPSLDGNWVDVGGPGPSPSSSSSGASPTFSGGGGRSGGGGASASWGDAKSSGGGGSGGGGKGGGGIDLDLGDGGAILLVLIALIVVVVLAGGYLVYAAPSVLGEAAFEFALSTGLVRAGRKLEKNDWEGSLLKGTALPFGIVLAAALGASWFVQRHCPGAGTWREALYCSSAPANETAVGN